MPKMTDVIVYASSCNFFQPNHASLNFPCVDNVRLCPATCWLHPRVLTSGNAVKEIANCSSNHSVRISTAPAPCLHLWWRNCSPTEQLQLCNVGGLLHVDHHSLQDLPQRFHCDRPFVAQMFPGFLCDLADIIMQKNTTLTWVFLFLGRYSYCTTWLWPTSAFSFIFCVNET